MKILITTGIVYPAVGGPALYAQKLSEHFARRGHEVRVLSYGIEKRLPVGVRHLWFFIRTLIALRGVDTVLTLDTFSVGFPTAAACRLLGKPVIVRIGGDFLWESYVSRTGESVTLSTFYTTPRDYSLKERIIHWSTTYLVEHATTVVFTNEWTQTILQEAYRIDPKKLAIVENFYGEMAMTPTPAQRLFLSPSRDGVHKNKQRLRAAFARLKEEYPDIVLDEAISSHAELMARIKDAYAVVLPSLSEVSPNLILEAIRYQTPFVVTREVGLYERINSLGLFVDPLDEDDIYHTMKALLDEEIYERYKDHLRRFTFTHSWEEIGDEFLALCRSGL